MLSLNPQWFFLIPALLIFSGLFYGLFRKNADFIPMLLFKNYLKKPDDAVREIIGEID